MILAVTCWHVWEAWNNVRNNDVLLHLTQFSSKVLAYVDMILNYAFRSRKAKHSEVAAMLPLWVALSVNWAC
jgi:hypothetical protein